MKQLITDRGISVAYPNSFYDWRKHNPIAQKPRVAIKAIGNLFPIEVRQRQLIANLVGPQA